MKDQVMDQQQNTDSRSASMSGPAEGNSAASKIDFHLQQAFAHLREALHASVESVNSGWIGKVEIGKKWEIFLGEFFKMVKTKSKENKLNLLSWVTLSRIWK